MNMNLLGGGYKTVTLLLIVISKMFKTCSRNVYDLLHQIGNFTLESDSFHAFHLHVTRGHTSTNVKHTIINCEEKLRFLIDCKSFHI